MESCPPATLLIKLPVDEDWRISRSLDEHEPLTAYIRLWEDDHQGTLTNEQVQCLITIGQLEQTFAGWPSYEDTHCQTHATIRKRYDKAIRYALRAELAHHPLVSAWKTRHKQLHGRGALRNAKMGLERGVSRKPLPDEIDAWLHEQILQGQAAGNSLRAVYRQLGPQKRLPKSFEGFRQYVKRHELRIHPESLLPHYLTEQLWQTIKPLLMTYDPPSDLPRGGRPRLNARTVLDAIVHKHRTREPWHALPTTIFPPASSVHQIFQRWRTNGLLHHIWKTLQATYADLGSFRTHVGKRRRIRRSASTRKKRQS